MGNQEYDLIIIGAGPAGLAAAVYAARYQLRFCVFSRLLGGMITESDRVENWPGEKRISGLELMGKFEEHARGLGAEIIEREVTRVEKDGPGFRVEGDYRARKILITQGSEKRKLGVPGEDKYAGRGVSYCATCDGAFFRNRTVCVVGGNDSSVIAALVLSGFAARVYIVYRKEKVRAEPILLERMGQDPKITVINNANITEIKGENMVRSVLLDREHKGSPELAVDGVFVEIGSIPDTGMAAGLGAELEDGYIKTDPAQRTSVPGVYAAGDITTNSNRFQQVITAAAEGAVAVNTIYADLQKEKNSR